MSMDLIDIAMAAAMKKGGGSGGTSDYTDLSNKPQINSVTLTGNKSASDLGIQPTIDTTHKLDADLVDDSTSGHKFAWSGTQAEYAQAAANIAEGELVAFTDDTDIDTTPTQGSDNPVTSDGIYRELAKLKVINENPENHNGIYRGKNLTNVYTVEQIYERVHDGSFEDLYLGDYFTVHLTTDLYTRFTGATFAPGTTYYEMGGTVIARTWTETQDAEPQEGKVYATKQVVTEDVDLMICGFDYYLHQAGTAHIKNHHAILIPRSNGFTTKAPMHYSATENVAYCDTDMNQIILPCYAASIAAALNGHLVSIPARLATAISDNVPSMCGSGRNGAVTASANVDVYLQLMTELQVFGTSFCGSSWYDVGLDYYKLPVFNFVNLHYAEDASDGVWLRTFMYKDEVYQMYMQVQISAAGQAGSTAYPQMRKVRPTMIFG